MTSVNINGLNILAVLPQIPNTEWATFILKVEDIYFVFRTICQILCSIDASIYEAFWNKDVASSYYDRNTFHSLK